MGQIYSAPEEIKIPEIGHDYDANKYWKDCEQYLENVKKWAKTHSKDPMAGKEVQFPAGDGAAVYVILSLKPVKLIHIATGDAWNFPYVHRLTAADIRKRIIGDEALKNLFRKAKRKQNAKV